MTTARNELNLPLLIGIVATAAVLLWRAAALGPGTGDASAAS